MAVLSLAHALPDPSTSIVSSSAAELQTTASPIPQCKQAAAATVLGRVFGEVLFATQHEGVLKGGPEWPAHQGRREDGRRL